VGDTVHLAIERGARRFTLSVTVAERPEDPERFSFMVTPEKNLVAKLGILAVELDESVRKMLPKRRRADGVVVAARAGSASLEEAPLPGDVICALNSVSVRSLSELRSAAERLKPGDAVVPQVERKGQLLYLASPVE
jgi:S1-C subfamily serine protease